MPLTRLPPLRLTVTTLTLCLLVTGCGTTANPVSKQATASPHGAVECRKALLSTVADPRFLTKVKALYAASSNIQYVNQSPWDIDTQKLVTQTTRQLNLIGFGVDIPVDANGRVAAGNSPTPFYTSPIRVAEETCANDWHPAPLNFRLVLSASLARQPMQYAFDNYGLDALPSSAPFKLPISRVKRRLRFKQAGPTVKLDGLIYTFALRSDRWSVGEPEGFDLTISNPTGKFVHVSSLAIHVDDASEAMSLTAPIDLAPGQSTNPLQFHRLLPNVGQALSIGVYTPAQADEAFDRAVTLGVAAETTVEGTTHSNSTNSTVRFKTLVDGYTYAL